MLLNGRKKGMRVSWWEADGSVQIPDGPLALRNSYLSKKKGEERVGGGSLSQRRALFGEKNRSSLLSTRRR